MNLFQFIFTIFAIFDAYYEDKNIFLKTVKYIMSFIGILPFIYQFYRLSRRPEVIIPLIIRSIYNLLIPNYLKHLYYDKNINQSTFAEFSKKFIFSDEDGEINYKSINGYFINKDLANIMLNKDILVQKIYINKPISSYNGLYKYQVTLQNFSFVLESHEDEKYYYNKINDFLIHIYFHTPSYLFCICYHEKHEKNRVTKLKPINRIGNLNWFFSNDVYVIIKEKNKWFDNLFHRLDQFEKEMLYLHYFSLLITKNDVIKIKINHNIGYKNYHLVVPINTYFDDIYMGNKYFNIGWIM